MNPTFEFKGASVELTSKTIEITRPNSLLIPKHMRGITSIIYREISKVDFKLPSTASKGFIQFTTPHGGLRGSLRANDQRENSIEFKKK